MIPFLRAYQKKKYNVFDLYFYLCSLTGWKISQLFDSRVFPHLVAFADSALWLAHLFVAVGCEWQQDAWRQVLDENLWTIVVCAFCSSSFRPGFSPSLPLEDTNFGCHCWKNERKLFKIQVNLIKAFYFFKKWMCAFHFVTRWFRQKMRETQHFWTMVGQVLCLGIPETVHIIFKQ